MNQAYRNFWVSDIDDSSTDGAGDVCNELSTNMPGSTPNTAIRRKMVAFPTPVNPATYIGRHAPWPGTSLRLVLTHRPALNLRSVVIASIR